MTRKYSIELIEEHDAVNFYSIQLADEELSELERFFEKFLRAVSTTRILT